MSKRLARARGWALLATLAVVMSGLVPLALPAPKASAADLAFLDVAAGRAHSCALTTTGYVWCWGSNGRGQLGLGEQVTQASTPTVVPGLHDVAAITAGANHTCALVDDPDGDRLVCWGANNTGQLGIGTTSDEATPQPVPDLVDVNSVAAGRAHTCAVTDGGTAGARTWCWGSNSFGQLGNGEIVEAPFGDFESEQGQITTDPAGNLYVLDPDFGGIRMFKPSGEYDRNVASGLVFGGEQSVAVLAPEGEPSMVFTGAGASQVHWINPVTNANGFWDVCTLLELSGCTGFVGVGLAAGQDALYVTAASPAGAAVGRLSLTGELLWSDKPTYDTAGGLTPFPLAGDVTSGPGVQGAEQAYFPLARAPLAPVVSLYGEDGSRTKNVNVGISSPCTDGSVVDRVRGVGLSADGELGLAIVSTGAGGTVEGWCVETRDSTGALATRFGGPPTTAAGEVGTVIDVAGAPDGSWFLADADHTSVLKAGPDGALDQNWGHYPFRSVPQEVRLLTSPWSGVGAIGPANRVVVGAQHSCVLTTPPGAWCWGSNDAGQIDPDDPGGSSTFPILAPYSAGAVGGDAGDTQTCTQELFGVQCWGDDEAPPPFMDSADDVAVGNGFRCLVVDGAVTCTGPGGTESDGQYGDGGTPCPETPGTVQTCDGPPSAPLAGASQIAAGNAHACTVAELGTSVYCWGRNDDHQVSPSDEDAIDHAVKVAFPTAPDVLVGFEGPTEAAPEPPVTVTFSPPVDNLTPDNVGVLGAALQAGTLLSLSGGPSGGTFDITVGAETATVPFSASAADVETALVGLPGVGFGEVEVDRSGTGSDEDPLSFTVRLLGALADAAPVIVGDGGDLTGPSAPYDVAATPLGLSCWDADDVAVDCVEGPVAAARLTPEGTLGCASPLAGQVNEAALPDEDLVLWGGFVLDPTTSDSLPVPCPDVRLTGPDVSSPDTEVQLPQAGPFLVRFERPVRNVTTAAFTVSTTTPDGTVQVPVDEPTCLGTGGDVVSCVEGPVRRALLTPASLLTCDATYGVDLNAAVSPETAVRWGTFLLEEATSAPLTVACGGDDPDDPEITNVKYRWGSVVSRRAFGKRFLVERDAGADASYTFTGRRLTWVTVLGPDMGKARVSIDGNPVGVVNNYAKRRIHRAKWRYPGLGPGEHTVKVTVLGKKGARKATGTRVAVDAFVVGRKVKRNPTMRATWTGREYTVADEGSVVTSQVARAAAVVRFVGTQLEWGTLRGPAQGTAKLVVDGVLVRKVRNYRTGETTARTVVLDNLTPGAHVVRIVVTGQGKGKRSGAGTYVAVDRLNAS